MAAFRQRISIGYCVSVRFEITAYTFFDLLLFAVYRPIGMAEPRKGNMVTCEREEWLIGTATILFPCFNHNAHRIFPILRNTDRPARPGMEPLPYLFVCQMDIFKIKYFPVRVCEREVPDGIFIVGFCKGEMQLPLLQCRFFQYCH